VSPVVSPVPPREQITVNLNHPVHLPMRLNSGPANINNTMAWQHPQMHPQTQQQPHQQPQQQQQQQYLQINTSSSHDGDEHEKNDTNSDVSSIPWGSIRPDPNYDPAKDPMSPERIDEPFVAPAEITIRVVKSRRRKTMGSYNSTTTHSTNVTPPHSSSVEEDKQQYSKLNQSPDLPTTKTGNSSVPMLGMISSFASDESNSFSGSAEQFATAEDLMYLEKDLLGLQMEGHEAPKQRKGMVRREFNRRILRFKKKKGHRNEIAGENNDDDDDDDDDEASGNKIIIQVNSNDNANKLNKPKKPKSFKKMDKFAAQFHGKIKHRSNSMRLVVGQENGC